MVALKIKPRFMRGVNFRCLYHAFLVGKSKGKQGSDVQTKETELFLIRQMSVLFIIYNQI